MRARGATGVATVARPKREWARNVNQTTTVRCSLCNANFQILPFRVLFFAHASQLKRESRNPSRRPDLISEPKEPHAGRHHATTAPWNVNPLGPAERPQGAAAPSRSWRLNASTSGFVPAGMSATSCQVGSPVQPTQSQRYSNIQQGAARNSAAVRPRDKSEVNDPRGPVRRAARGRPCN